MSDATGPKRDREQIWQDIVVPAARGLEAFFWNLVWFVVIVFILFSFNPFTQGCRHEDRTVAPVAGQAISEQPADQR